MDLRVFWTDTALNQLENIFSYHKTVASITIARKIVKRIVDKTIKLENNPRMGQREELLLERSNEYRYLVVGNYKVIYWIDGEYIKIATVFDTRQNPKKIENI